MLLAEDVPVDLGDLAVAGEDTVVVAGDDPLVLGGELIPEDLDGVVETLRSAGVEEDATLVLLAADVDDRVRGALLDDRDVVGQEILELIHTDDVSRNSSAVVDYNPICHYTFWPLDSEVEDLFFAYWAHLVDLDPRRSRVGKKSQVIVGQFVGYR